MATKKKSKKAKGKKKPMKKSKRMAMGAPRDTMMEDTGVVASGMPPPAPRMAQTPPPGGPMPMPNGGMGGMAGAGRRKRYPMPRRAASPTKGPKCACPM